MSVVFALNTGKARTPRYLRESWRTLRHDYVKPTLRRIAPWRRRRLNGIYVYYMHHLDGGGSDFGQQYIPYLRNRGMPVQPRTFEWCAGPAFIGFSMLGAGVTKTLCLADINPAAVGACKRTIADNSLHSQVSVYRSDNLASIPGTEQWDLVVGNPPHYSDEYIGHLRAHDPEWRIHRGFFSQIANHLKPGGVIVLQENGRGSTPETFREMIADGGLELIFVEFGPKKRTADQHIYYIGVGRRGDAVPAWAQGTICT